MTSVRARAARLRPLPEHPLVTVILAVRNEARHIARALDAVRQQDWPRDHLEILVADGDSDDGTRDIVRLAMEQDPRVQLLENPSRHVAAGLNVGLAAARGSVVVRVDGHCRVPASYVRTCIRPLRSGEAECTGGPVVARGDGVWARAIAHGMSTPFGAGGAAFRWASERREVDHLPFGAWRREVFGWIGTFDETLVRNQDEELSDRLRRAGGRILMLPEIASDYWCRGTLGALWRQYAGYGFWKVRVVRKRAGWPSSPRHLVPAALLTAVMGGIAAALVTGVGWLAAIVPATYAAFLACATIEVALVRRDRASFLLPVVLPVMHFGYGVGLLRGLLSAAMDSRAARLPAGGMRRASGRSVRSGA